MSAATTAPGALRAFHGDASVQAKYLDRVRAHRAADEIVQGHGYWKDGRGCAVGCSIHGRNHHAYETELGIPKELAYLEDYLFELLPVEQAREWPLRFLAAPRLGADLTGVYDLWCAWMLVDPEHGVLRLVSDDYPEVQRVVRETADACVRHERVNAAESTEAAEAAGAAWAADAAWAARAAEVAEVARAAWAARAAGAAAAAAAAAAAWAAEYTACWVQHAADKLIELMEAA